MDPKNHDYFISWANRLEFKQLINSTITQIQDLFDIFKRPSVSFSGGKDSMVLLHLCLKLKPDIFVWHWDYGIFMPRSIEYDIKNILITKFHVSNLTIDRRNSTDENSSIGYRAFFGALNRYVRKNDIDVSLIGLRAEESISRRKRCKRLLEYHRGTNIVSAFPLRNWIWRDIWAYIIIFKLPYLQQYDIKAKLLGSYEFVRFVTFFDSEFESYGSIEQDKFLFYSNRNRD